MVNKNNKLTVDDLIVEYMLAKVKGGHEPIIHYYEFVNFLYNFETKMKVADTLYETPDLFERFIIRKNEFDWNNNPHIELEYDQGAEDYVLKANSKLSSYDRSLLNTYFMEYNEKEKIHAYIEEYLEDCPKRIIKKSNDITEEEKAVGRYVSAKIINYVWLSHIGYLIQLNKWPKQCKDINNYLFGIDLSEVINIPSIKDDLIELYKDLSLKIASLYHNDKNLEISTESNKYLANSNFKLLREGNERFFDIAFGFGTYKRTLNIDVKNLKFNESYEINIMYELDKDYDENKTTEELDQEKVKKIIHSIENINK